MSMKKYGLFCRVGAESYFSLRRMQQLDLDFEGCVWMNCRSLWNKPNLMYPLPHTSLLSSGSPGVRLWCQLLGEGLQCDQVHGTWTLWKNHLPQCYVHFHCDHHSSLYCWDIWNTLPETWLSQQSMTERFMQKHNEWKYLSYFQTVHVGIIVIGTFMKQKVGARVRLHLCYVSKQHQEIWEGAVMSGLARTSGSFGVFCP